MRRGVKTLKKNFFFKGIGMFLHLRETPGALCQAYFL